jgi:YVTN family beta-propeller protein
LGLTLATLIYMPAHGQEARDRLWLVNQRDQTLLAISSGPDRAIIGRAVTGRNGHEIALSRDGRLAYVPIYGDSGLGRTGSDGSTIEVFDTSSLARVAIIDLGRPLRPHSVQVGRDGLLYVTAELANSVLVIDPGTRQVVGEIPTGRDQSHMLALSPDGRRGYTANVSSGTISTLDLVDRRLLAVVPAAPRIQRLSISPDGRHVYTHDLTRPQAVVIDTATNSVARTISLPGLGYASAPTPDGRFLVVASPQGDVGAREENTGRVYVVDLRADVVVASFPMHGYPMAITISADGRRGYVSCLEGGVVAVLDLIHLRVDSLIQLTAGVDGMAMSP